MPQPTTDLLQRLRALPAASLGGIRRGIEKESLRARADGSLALTPHPAALGSALTHPQVTTDFSESQLELITGVHGDVQGALDELRQIHQFVYRQLGDERLWVGSMPCQLPADEAIPIAQFGSSNVGRSKSVYRLGLSQRYGRRMQTISGIHYNWSMPGVTTEGYFGLIRNFRRHSFLLLYLFGASPALGSGFLSGQAHPLERLGPDTHGLPHATSLRMGRLGYQSDAQATLAVSYNCLDSYGASLQDALTRPYPPYEAIGIRDEAGHYRQLATTLLQIENEFYGTIRPKRVIRPGERPLHALRERGVEYVEVRCMDLDPFALLGIDAGTARFIDLFLLHSLLSDSPPDTPAEIAALARNQDRTAARGREPGLRLERGGQEVTLVGWATTLLDEFEPIAQALDTSHGGSSHRDSLRAARAALGQPQRLPSARVLDAMRRDFGGEHQGFMRAQSEQTRRELLVLPWPAELQAQHEQRVLDSVREQARIEAGDRLDFEAYRQQYLSPQRLRA